MAGISTETNTQLLNNKELIHTSDGSVYRKRNYTSSIFLSGGAAACGYAAVGIVANFKVYNNWEKMRRSFSSYDLDEFSKGFSKLLEDNGCSDKLLDISKKSSVKVLWNDMYDYVQSNKFVSKLLSLDGIPQTKEHLEVMKTYLLESIASQNGIKVGTFEYEKLRDDIATHVMRTQRTASIATHHVQNALSTCPLYYNDMDKIVLSKAKSSASGFHEFGHMMNFKNPLLKANYKISRFGNLLSLLILGITIFKRPKAEGEKPEGFFDKATTFVRDNAVTLTALAQMPRLIDEASASLTGYKYAKAKNYLNPSQLKKMSKYNGKALLSYLTLAGGFVAAVGAAKMVKNWLNKPQKVEQG